MRVLLDTHLVLWAMQDSRRLSKRARSLLGRSEAAYVSTVSLWEIAIKAALGRLTVDSEELEAQLDAAGFLPLAVEWRHATALRKLPALHRDPFDRMLIAQAVSEPLHLLTHDEALVGYSELVVRV